MIGESLALDQWLERFPKCAPSMVMPACPVCGRPSAFKRGWITNRQAGIEFEACHHCGARFGWACKLQRKKLTPAKRP
jgi:hypothetical protein